MSRLYGRTIDIYNISKFFIANYHLKYKKDGREISVRELEEVASVIAPYLRDEDIEYLNKADIEICWNRFIKDTIYSGPGEEKNVIFFPSKRMKEEYKRDLLYYMGDLLRRISFDYLPDEYDIRCQYSDVLPLLIEYLYLRDTGNADRFSEKHLYDLALNAKGYVKIYDSFKKLPSVFSEDYFLRNSLLYLVPLSSMDATLQISDEIANDKEELRNLIVDLISNPGHDRESVMEKRKINTYGFKRLRKEIDLRNRW